MVFMTFIVSIKLTHFMSIDNLEIAKYLIKYGASANGDDHHCEVSPLMGAASQGKKL